MFFWKRRGRGETEERPSNASAPLAAAPKPRRRESGAAVSPGEPVAGTVELQRDEPRPAAIRRAAEELEARGERLVGLFEEISSPRGRAVLPIRLGREPGQDLFVEVMTAPWDKRAVEGLLRSAAVLRGSELNDATLEVLSAYPVPDEVGFFSGRSAAALFQLDLFDRDDARRPEDCAAAFVEAAARHWGLSLNYGSEGLPLVEELLLAALAERTGDGENPPILDALAGCLGCYVGETLRRNAATEGSWRTAAEWAEGPVVEFPNIVADPIGKSRAFLNNGPDDSVAFYVTYALKELAVVAGHAEGHG